MCRDRLKRALLVLLAMSGILMLYLYWYQTSIIPRYLPNMEINNEKSHTVQWTWVCEHQQCKRRVSEGSSSSLRTCSILCGSTQLWPQPTGPVKLSGRVVNFSHQQMRLESYAQEPVRSLLEQYFVIFKDTVKNLVPEITSFSKKADIFEFLVKVSVTLSNITRLQLETDESYNLTVYATSDGDLVSFVQANTYFGARHGLETLLQLIWWDEYGHTLKTLNFTRVQDSPVFPYRGLMVDTSRNFIPLENLKSVLVGMSANKLNVFHWHVSDSQSFPLVTPRVPQLAEYGAYGPDMIYSPEDVKTLVEFARLRGIKVIIEVDTPAHVGNGWTWGPQAGLGELAVCVNAQPWSEYCGEPPCGQLNPGNPHVYDVLEKLYRDILQMSEDGEMFHLGGDEVNMNCWKQQLNKSLSIDSDLNDLLGEYTTKALSRLKAANNGKSLKYIIVWSSPFTASNDRERYLDKEHTVVQVWSPTDWNNTLPLLTNGYRVIISHVDAWYLDCGFGNWRMTGEAACSPYKTWQNVYMHRPWASWTLNTKEKLVLGGEVCLWSEQVGPSTLDSRLWPRSAAFAERVWSDPKIVDANEDVFTRLSTQRERLLSRGIGVDVMWPMWCTQNPGMCL